MFPFSVCPLQRSEAVCGEGQEEGATRGDDDLKEHHHT